MNPEIQMPIPPEVRFVLDRLESCGCTAYCVGGCVRDHLMHRTPGDYDVTTSAKPNDTLRFFSDCRTVETGLQHGTVTVVRGGMNIEITTYRIDGAYDDGRHPDSVTFTDRLSDDLCRRDFTVNAMAYSPARGLVDLYGGQNDLERRVIRCVGRAEDRFREDGLRILRALRFSSVLGFTPDEECADAIRHLTPLLARISRERIAAELSKLLSGQSAPTILAAFPETAAFVLPHVTSDDVRDAAETIRRLNEIHPAPDSTLCYALLLRHLSDGDLREAVDSLKPSREAKNAILRYRTFADAPLDGDIARMQLMRRTDDGFPVMLAAFRAACGEGSADDVRTIAACTDRIVSENRCRRLSMLALHGGDLTALGFSGKSVGDTLNRLLDAVINSTLPNTRDALTDMALRLKEDEHD